MADLKISQLTETALADSGDFLIINKGDATTQKIDFKRIIDALGSGGSGGDGTGGFGFAPMFHNFSSSANFTQEVSSWASTDNIHPGASATYKMPSNADRALISFSYSCSMTHLPNGSVPGETWCQFGGGLEISGATAEAGCGSATNSICMGASMNNAAIDIGSQAQSYETFRVNMHPVKFSMLSFTPGATLTLTATGNMKRAKKCIANKSAGRFILFPFNSAAVDIAAIGDFVASASIEDGDMPAELIPNEKEMVETKIVAEGMRYVADLIEKTEDDPFFVDPAAPADNVATIKNELYSLRNSQDSFEVIQAKIDELITRLRAIPGVTLNLGFSPAGLKMMF